MPRPVNAKHFVPEIPKVGVDRGDDGSTLYITADMFLYRVKTTTKGF